MNSFIQLSIITTIIFNIIPLYNCIIWNNEFNVRRCLKENKLSVIPDFKLFSVEEQIVHINYEKESIAKSSLDFHKESTYNGLDIHDTEEFENNKNYNFVPDIIRSVHKGIQETVKTLQGYNKHGIPKFFERNDKFIDILSREDLKFQAFAPDNFLNLRMLYNISEKFTESFNTSSLIEIQDPRVNKINLYYTEDMKFVVEIINKKEQQVLRSILPELFSHFCEQPNSLLPKLSGLYYIKYNSDEAYIIVMPNNYPYKLQKGVNLQYYIQGNNRLATQHKKEKSFRLLDNDFVTDFQKGLTIAIPSDVIISLKQKLGNDLQLLKKLNITNYSVLFTFKLLKKPMVNKDNLGQQTFKSLYSNQIIVNYENKTYILYIRFDNILQSYDLLKKLERAVKSPIMNYLGVTVTIQDPETYAKRLMEFINSAVFKSSGQNIENKIKN